MTGKAGTSKKASVFCKLLCSALSHQSTTTTADLLSFHDLEAMRTSATSPGGSPQSAPSLKFSNKRYLIISYTSEFEKVRYPLPLEYVPPTIDHVISIAKRLYSANEELKAKLSVSLQSDSKMTAQAVNTELAVLRESLQATKKQLEQANITHAAQIASYKEKRTKLKLQVQVLTAENMQLQSELHSIQVQFNTLGSSQRPRSRNFIDPIPRTGSRGRSSSRDSFEHSHVLQTQPRCSRSRSQSGSRVCGCDGGPTTSTLDRGRSHSRSSSRTSLRQPPPIQHRRSSSRGSSSHGLSSQEEKFARLSAGESTVIRRTSRSRSHSPLIERVPTPNSRKRSSSGTPRKRSSSGSPHKPPVIRNGPPGSYMSRPPLPLHPKKRPVTFNSENVAPFPPHHLTQSSSSRRLLPLNPRQHTSPIHNHHTLPPPPVIGPLVVDDPAPAHLQRKLESLRYFLEDRRKDSH
ncbi:coiled-coil domain-containing protein 61 [Pelomyxa schiedti]|nr:coiled-coil domain-containing protein 61 [Pelomyxa schiedti]